MVLGETKMYGIPTILCGLDYLALAKGGTVMVYDDNPETIAKEAIKILKNETYRKILGDEARKSMEKRKNEFIEQRWAKLLSLVHKGDDESIFKISQTQFNQLLDRIKKLEKSNIEKEKLIKEEEKKNSYDENKLRIINNYKSILSEDVNNINQKKKQKEETDSLLKEKESEINSLQEQLNNLNSKMYKYRDEKPKLLRKANEPKKDIEKMESLKKELEKLKNNKEKTEPRHLPEVNILKMNIKRHLVHPGYNPQSQMLSQLVAIKVSTYHHRQP